MTTKEMTMRSRFEDLIRLALLLAACGAGFGALYQEYHSVVGFTYEQPAAQLVAFGQPNSQVDRTRE